MKTKRCYDGAVRVSECATIAEIRGKVAAFRALFGEDPSLTACNTFTCAKSGTLVFLRNEERATIGRTLITIDLRHEGKVYVDAGEVSKMEFYLRAQVKPS